MRNEKRRCRRVASVTPHQASLAVVKTYMLGMEIYKDKKMQRAQESLAIFSCYIRDGQGVLATPAALNSIDLNESSGRATVFCSE